jgi:hypothetical protein
VRAIVGGCRRTTACLVAVLFAMLAPAHARADTCAGADAQAGQLPTAALERATLCLLDDERAAHGLRPLAVAPPLTETARRYAADMVATASFSHVDAKGGDVTSRVLADDPSLSALWIEFGENLGCGVATAATPRSIVTAWMGSAEHRADILDGDWNAVGVGIAPGDPLAEGAAGALTYDVIFANLASPDPPPAPKMAVPTVLLVHPHRSHRHRHRRPTRRATTHAARRA